MHVLPPPFAAAAGRSTVALDVQQCRGLNEALEALTFIHLQHISRKTTQILFIGAIGVYGFVLFLFFCICATDFVNVPGLVPACQ